MDNEFIEVLLLNHHGLTTASVWPHTLAYRRLRPAVVQPAM